MQSATWGPAPLLLPHEPLPQTPVWTLPWTLPWNRARSRPQVARLPSAPHPRAGVRPDPYGTPEAAAATRRDLEWLLACESREVGLATGSPRILADLDLLREVDQHHAVTLTLLLPAAEAELARRLDPLSAEPRAVLAALARLAGEGLTTRLQVQPLRPGVNTMERALRPLFEAAFAAGAVDVVPDPLAPDAALATFRRLRLAHGFPQPRPGRG